MGMFLLDYDALFDFFSNPWARSTRSRLPSSSNLARRAHSRDNKHRPFRPRFHNFRNLPPLVPLLPTALGHSTRSRRCPFSMYTISPATMDDLETATRHELEYTNDVYTDPRIICFRYKFGDETRCGRMECLGCIYCHWYPTRLLVGYGNQIRNQGSEGEEEEDACCGEGRGEF